MIYALLALLPAAAVGLYVWGIRLPQTLQLSRDILVNAPVERVWRIMTDSLRQVEWRTDLESIEMAAGQGDRWIERRRHRAPTDCRVLRQEPGRLLEIERFSDGLSSGRWTATLEAAARATRLTLNETILIRNPLARVWLRMQFDPAASLQRYERDLKTRAESFSHSTEAV